VLARLDDMPGIRESRVDASGRCFVLASDASRLASTLAGLHPRR